MNEPSTKPQPQNRTEPPPTLISRFLVRPRQQTGLVICWLLIGLGCVWCFVASRGSDATLDIDVGRYDPFAYTVDLNTAGQAELASIPGIGIRTAGAIVQWRTENGDFETVDKLAQVDGISQKTVDSIRPFLTPIRSNPIQSESIQRDDPEPIRHGVESPQGERTNFSPEPQQEYGD